MATFVVYNISTGVLQGKYQVSPDSELADAMTAHTTATLACLTVDESVTPITDTSLFLVENNVLTAVDPIPLLQNAQVALVQQSYLSHINDGFLSSALGSPYLYPNTSDDQFNLTASIVASLIPFIPSTWTTIFLCGSSATPSVWNYLPHTPAQIQQVGLDSLAYSVGAKQKQAQLISEIQAATTVAAIQAIVW